MLMGVWIMTKQELTLAIRICKYVFAIVHLTEHDSLNTRVVKSDLLYDLSKWDTEYWNSFKAFIGEDGNLYIG